MDNSWYYQNVSFENCATKNEELLPPSIEDNLRVRVIKSAR